MKHPVYASDTHKKNEDFRFILLLKTINQEKKNLTAPLENVEKVWLSFEQGIDW